MSPAETEPAEESSQPSAPTEARSGARRYRVFISYSHADGRWAAWLMRRLEGYRVPARLQGRTAPIGTVGPRIAPVFRDRDELPSAGDLGETIRAALAESATLVVICSPQAARSRWVNEEIVTFKRLHGGSGVLALIVSGEPKVAGAEDDCFPPALREEVGADGRPTGRVVEVIAADARPQGDGPKLAWVRLAAGLLGVGFDELRQRELQRRNRRLTLIAAAAAVGMAVTLGLAVVAWQARNDAVRRQGQAEDVLAFMLGDFRSDLEKVGQLALLEKVGDKAMAYFDALDARDLTDTALARQAKALTQIGEVRLQQKDVRYADAARAFVTAYRRAAELAARHPGDGRMLFERAQAEYWIGHTHYRRGDFEPAAEWLRRYRDSTRALAALDPNDATWRGELAWGHHNLAVLEVQRGRLDEAKAGFAEEREILRRLLAARPKDTDLAFRLTDVDSFLGTIEARAGNLAEAVRRFEAQRQGLEALRQAEPTRARWTATLAECLSIEAEVLAVTGQRERALAGVRRGLELIGPLVARDPKNRRWSGVRSVLEMREAAWRGDLAEDGGLRRIEAAVAVLAAHLADEPGDRLAATRLLGAQRQQARLLAGADRAAAARIVAQAVAQGMRLLRDNRGNDRVVGELAASRVLAGRLAADAGDLPASRQEWTEAKALLAGAIGASRDWVLLDPAVRALELLGEDEAAAPLRRRLAESGYVPIEPWPISAGEFPVRN